MVPDVSKSITVDVPAAEAFALFVEQPMGWWPEKHVFVADRRSITIEPHVGGRYYETDVDGTEVTWGTVKAFAPPHRVVLTWRVGVRWRPLYSDVMASLIEVDFTEVDARTTRVTLTHAQLDRHGEIAEAIHAALDGPSPGETLTKFAELVARSTSSAV